MEKDFRSWMVHGQQDVQLNEKPSALPFDAGLRSISTSHAVPGVYNSVYTNGNYPSTMFPFQPKAKETQPNHRLYHLPGFGQGFMSGENMALNEKYLAGAQKVPTYTSGCSPKQFLVFDQSGDKTTLIYSSGIDTPVCLNPWSSNSKPKLNCNNEEKEKIGVCCEMHATGPSLTDELNANYSEAEDKSEMREDTEEINALLYSDDDDDDSAQKEEDDDVVSTGHSPSIITAYNDYKQDGFEVEDGEEVASSGGPIKRQRISGDGYGVPCLMDTARSTKPSGNFQYEDDAESKCTDNCARYLNDDNDDAGSVCGKKRSRKERIRETIEILQSIIPCCRGKGLDAALVLDESIRYLRSLRGKARSLGLSAL